MPNGFYGPKEQLDKLEEPLLQLDPHLQDFCAEHGFNVTKNDRNNINRAIRWTGPDGISRLINLFLADEQEKIFKLLATATQTRPEGEYVKSQWIITGTRPPLKQDEIMSSIESGKVLLEGWGPRDLRKVNMG